MINIIYKYFINQPKPIFILLLFYFIINFFIIIIHHQDTIHTTKQQNKPNQKTTSFKPQLLMKRKCTGCTGRQFPFGHFDSNVPNIIRSSLHRFNVNSHELVQYFCRPILQVMSYGKNLLLATTMGTLPHCSMFTKV